MQVKSSVGPQSANGSSGIKPEGTFAARVPRVAESKVTDPEDDADGCVTLVTTPVKSSIRSSWPVERLLLVRGSVATVTAFACEKSKAIVPFVNVMALFRLNSRLIPWGLAVLRDRPEVPKEISEGGTGVIPETRHTEFIGRTRATTTMFEP